MRIALDILSVAGVVGAIGAIAIGIGLALDKWLP